MVETYLSLNFQKDTSGFEKNQQVSIEQNNGVLHCQSQQTHSTPGLLRKNIRLPKKDSIYCLEVTGWSNCNRAFVQVIDQQTNNRLINGYRYLSSTESTLRMNFRTDSLISIAILFGGNSSPGLEDQLWVKEIKITNRDLSDQPDAPHRQEVILTKSSTTNNNKAIWPNPLPAPAPVDPPVFHSRKEAQKVLNEDPSQLIQLSPTYWIYLDPDGYLRYLSK